LGLAFFGLTPTSAKQHRIQFLTQIHEICFHGQGGYSWTEVYEMPLWLRKFVYQKIKEHYDKQAKQIEEAKQNKNSNTQNLINPDGTVKFPTKSSYK
jgi:hypothetical protein